MTECEIKSTSRKSTGSRLRQAGHQMVSRLDGCALVSDGLGSYVGIEVEDMRVHPHDCMEIEATQYLTSF